MPPVATYRVQLHAGFGFNAAREMVPYLHALGVSHLYTSPLYQARRGSLHGYDVTDPTCLNPELGSAEEFDALVDSLHEHGMGLLLDIVPNHMAVSAENPWWMDVLAKGAGSAYAHFFSVQWEAIDPQQDGQILMPILGEPFGTALENGRLCVKQDQDGLFVHYYSHCLPLAPSTYTLVLEQAPALPQPLQELTQRLQALPMRPLLEEEALEQWQRESAAAVKELARLYGQDEAVRLAMDAALLRLNGTPGDARSMDALEQLLNVQAYRLAYWQVAREKINYRRFFDVTDLIGVRVEEPDVFAATHALTLRLAAEGKIDGLRIDHVDGLLHPRQYLDRLQNALQTATRRAEQYPVLVEKILIGPEPLPAEWPVQGTTGYDFTAMLNGLLVDAAGLTGIEHEYSSFVSSRIGFEETTRRSRVQVMKQLFPGEMQALGIALAVLAETDRYGRDLSPHTLGRALREITACFPVYRTYLESDTIRPEDRSHIEQAVSASRERDPNTPPEVYDFIQRVLLLDEGARPDWLPFVMRWQQISGPIMAKGVEDTSFYTYNRLVSLNEVGGDLRTYSVEEFHAAMQRRAQDWPLTMNATSTHDTKRGEDVRARLHVLSEMPDEWAVCVALWSASNQPHKLVINKVILPDYNEEYLLYQILLGAWPVSPDDLLSFRERLQAYLLKASREAKTYSSWLRPDEEYETAVRQFVEALLDPARSGAFLASFTAFQERIAFYGAVNSLTQVLLKITAPGVPDLYQGTAYWDLSLVDPDNRRPIDFPQRMEFLEVLRLQQDVKLPLLGMLLDNWQDGGIKLFLTYRALQFRKQHPALYNEGSYLPVAVEGPRQHNVVAFVRQHGARQALTVAPRLPSQLSEAGVFPVGSAAWQDTTLLLPGGVMRWRNVLTSEVLPAQKRLPMAAVLQHFPVALLAAVEE